MKSYLCCMSSIYDVMSRQKVSKSPCDSVIWVNKSNSLIKHRLFSARQLEFCQPEEKQADMNSIFGRLPPPCAMNGFNYNPPPAMEFYNPEASLYGMFSCAINKTWKNLSFCCVFSCRFFLS